MTRRSKKRTKNVALVQSSQKKKQTSILHSKVGPEIIRIRAKYPDAIISGIETDSDVKVYHRHYDFIIVDLTSGIYSHIGKYDIFIPHGDIIYPREIADVIDDSFH